MAPPTLRRDQLLAGLAAIAATQSFANGAHAQVTSQPAGAATAQPPVVAGRQSLGPAGYSLRYGDVRSLLMRGDFDGALSLFQTVPVAAQTQNGEPQEVAAPTGAAADDGQARRPLFSSRDVFLANSEVGLMHYECNRHQEAMTSFEAARATGGDSGGGVRNRLSQAGRWLGNRARQAAGVVLGRGDFGPYRKRDYEGVLQLNYLALNFMIQGDRRCYNVARASADEQEQLRARFAEQVAEAQQSLQQEQASDNGKTTNMVNTLNPEFATYAPIANRVPSAYVNPFGPYVSGVALEIASLEQPALRGNARGAYEEALALAPARAQLTQAVQAMNDNHTPGTRVVHVIVAEGFAPSRNVLRYGLPMDDGTVLPLRMGIFVPEISAVNRVEAAFTSGAANARRPVTLDPISDVEALVLRDQSDRLLFMWLDLLVSAYRDRQTEALEAQINQFMGNQPISLDSVPDLRSWCSLPRRVHVARMIAPPGVNEVAITTRSSAGVLQRRTVALDPQNQQTLIYARATNDVLRVDTSRRLWVDGVDLNANAG